MAESDLTTIVCGVPLEAIQKLSDTTKLLLRLVEQIQSKTHTSRPIPEDPIKLSYMFSPQSPVPQTIVEEEETQGEIKYDQNDLALQSLELHAKHLESIEIQSEDNDCSIYKRLTRKCTCLNRNEYNDFIIHFNEDISSCTNSLGEIIKNVRILKKFLYMGNGYAENSLMFLNEGLEKSTHYEKLDIIQACSHADICNVFESNSIVTECIWWPYRDREANNVQSLTSTFLYNLALVEEGRRYLNFSTKISNDIKRVLKRKPTALKEITRDQLKTTLDLLNPPIARNLSVTYYWKAEEGMGFRTLNSLEMYRDIMTFEEIITHLDWLDSFSQNNKGRRELRQYLPNLLRVFKRMLIEYNNAEVNIYVTNILNNIVVKKVNSRLEELHSKHSFIVANVSTEPVPMKQIFVQVPSVKNIRGKSGRTPTKGRENYKRCI